MSSPEPPPLEAPSSRASLSEAPPAAVDPTGALVSDVSLSDASASDRSRSFAAFGLDARIERAIAGLGFDVPTPIQAQAMPPLLAGEDVIGRARTGSGKTAAYGLPLLERVKEGGARVRALVLVPTRELALQVTAALRSFAEGLPLRVVTIYGGAPYRPQLAALASGVAVVVGTPGRVLDHLARGTLELGALEVLVLDEADEMLAMGFLEDVEKVIAAAPAERQVALFSATMPEPIRRLVEARLPRPVEVQVERAALTVDHIEQRALVVAPKHKIDALARLLSSEPIAAALVFARTRAGCAEAADELAKRGVSVDALHGDLNQAARERVLSRFRSGQLQVVVATDVAARGIDVEGISHVINLDLPPDAEAYVHRIGRTGRAGRAGIAISLVTPREVFRVRHLEQVLGVIIARVEVPSDFEIASVRRTRLIEAVIAQADAEAEAGLAPILDPLFAEREPRRVAAALLRMLAAERGLDLAAVPEEEKPHRSPEPRRREPSADEVELFLPVGRKRGVRAQDVVGALANEVGIEGTDIGKVTILDHKSFVRVTREVAEKVLAHHPEIELRGRQVRIALARPRAAGAEGEPGARRGGFLPPRRKGKPGPAARYNRTK